MNISFSRFGIPTLAGVTGVAAFIAYILYIVLSVLCFQYDVGVLFGLHPNLLVSILGGIFLSAINVPIAILLFILSLAGLHGPIFYR